eukprot:7586562-Heterocapsa_arctica.AAC.1
MNRLKTTSAELRAVLQEHRPGNSLRQNKWRTRIYEDNCEMKENKKVVMDKTRKYRLLSKHIQISAQNTRNCTSKCNKFETFTEHGEGEVKAEGARGETNQVGHSKHKRE